MKSKCSEGPMSIWQAEGLTEVHVLSENVSVPFIAAASVLMKKEVKKVQTRRDKLKTTPKVTCPKQVKPSDIRSNGPFV